MSPYITFHKTRRGIAVLDLLIAGGLIFSVVFIFQLLLLQERASSRDLRRLTDIREAQALMERLFRATGSYAAAAESGCASVGNLFSSCNFSRIGVSISSLKDPGSGAYRVTTVPAGSEYGITFTLERNHTDIKAGAHLLTQKGIH